MTRTARWRRRTRKHPAVCSVEEPLVAWTVQLLVGGAIAHRTAQVRALLPKGNVTVDVQAYQQAGIARGRIVEHSGLPHRELVQRGDLYLRQRLCAPETPEPTKHRQDHIGEKRRQRDPDERLGKFAPGHKVVINPRDGEMVLPDRHLGHALSLSVLLVRQTGAWEV